MNTIDKTLTERQHTHGEFAIQAMMARDLKRIFRDGAQWPKLSAGQCEALDHIAVKISRILTGNPDHADSWHDIAGYASLAERELAQR